MALSVGDIIRITLCQKLDAQTTCNVFAYVVDAIIGTMLTEDIQLPFRTDIIPDINAIQSDQVENERLVVENLTNGIDFTDNGVGGGGLGPFPPVATFSAISFKYNRRSKVTRNGFKRFAGLRNDLLIDENTVDVSDSLIVTAANTLDSPFSVVDGADSAVLLPIILGTLPNGQPDLSRYQVVTEITPQALLTTQVTRKIGRGI